MLRSRKELEAHLGVVAKPKLTHVFKATGQVSGIRGLLCLAGADGGVTRSAETYIRRSLRDASFVQAGGSICLGIAA